MKSQTLLITGTNLETNEVRDVLILASNPFMLALKYSKTVNTIHVNSWSLINSEWEAGNQGINAGAYLCQQMEEMSGLNLA